MIDGERANKVLYPAVMKYFKISFNNDQTLDQLLNEIIKIKGKKKSGVRTFKMMETNGMKGTYLRIPSGVCRSGTTAIGTSTN